MSVIYNGKHLTLEDRKLIEEGIETRLRKYEIAKSINKSPSTVAKEIKKYRKPRTTNLYDTIPNNCINFKQCKVCHGKCKDYKEQICFKRDRFIGACNSCPDIKKCKLTKYFYSAKYANNCYLYSLKDSREGVNLTRAELVNIAHIIAPLIKQRTIYLSYIGVTQRNRTVS